MSLTHLTVSDSEVAAASEIRALPCTSCAICGKPGKILYRGLRDRLFTAPGNWNLKKCPDSACGLLWLDPMPIVEDIAKAYATYYTHGEHQRPTPEPSSADRLVRAIRQSYLAHTYGYSDLVQRTHGKTVSRLLGSLAYLHPFRRAWLDFSMMFLPYRPGGRLLEIGCGSGEMLRSFANSGWQTQGLDFDPAAVAASRAKGLRVELGTLEDQFYDPARFDAVVMSHVIEHVHDPVGLLAECRRILKPGGTLALVTPNAGALGHRLFGCSWFFLDPPRHLHIFTMAALRSALLAAGFERSEYTFSSLRDAAETFIGSNSIRRTARFQMGSHHNASEKLAGLTLQTAEWALLKCGVTVGEELVAVVEKEARC